MHGRDRFDIPFGILDECFYTVLATKIIGLPVVFMLPGGILWIHGHAADWVGGHADLLVAILTLNLADARPDKLITLFEQNKGSLFQAPGALGGNEPTAVINYWFRLSEPHVSFSNPSTHRR